MIKSSAGATPAAAVQPARRPHRSYSQLNTWLHCPHQYKLTKILRVPERPSVWLPAGSAVHEATEEFDRSAWKIGLPAHVSGSDEELVLPDEWGDVFDEKFEVGLAALREQEPDEARWRTAGRKTKDKPRGEDVAWWREAGRAMFLSYCKWRIVNNDRLCLAEIDGQAAIELEVSEPLGGVPQKSYIDRVFVDTLSGEPIVVDLKSGSRMPATPVQLAGYSVQLGDRVGRPVLWGAFWNARKGELEPPIDLSRWTNDLLGEIYQQLDAAIRTNIFPPHIDTHCVSCGVREFCKFQGGVEPVAPIARRSDLSVLGPVVSHSSDSEAARAAS